MHDTIETGITHENRLREMEGEIAALEAENAGLKDFIRQLADRLEICSRLLGRAAEKGRLTSEEVEGARRG